MRISLRKLCGGACFFAFVLAAALPLSGKMGDEQDEKESRGNDATKVVLYDGPLIHDQNWAIKHGPPGPENQLLNPLGGTCSLVQSDTYNGSAMERVTFETERQEFGIWKMVWKDTVTGNTLDGNRYSYQQRVEFYGVTTNGREPKPSHAKPTSQSQGFLDAVPPNVYAPSLDLNDFFLLSSSTGNPVAHSDVHGIFRRQIPPEANDPPPSSFPFVVSQHFILNMRQGLSGQLGCDPL